MYNKIDPGLKLELFEELAASKSLYDFIILMNSRLEQHKYGTLVDVAKEVME
jgi:hypothetical protein